MTAHRPVSETSLAVTVTVQIGEEMNLAHTVQLISGSPLNHAYTAKTGIDQASTVVLNALAGAFGATQPTPGPPAVKT